MLLNLCLFPKHIHPKIHSLNFVLENWSTSPSYKKHSRSVLCLLLWLTVKNIQISGQQFHELGPVVCSFPVKLHLVNSPFLAFQVSFSLTDISVELSFSYAFHVYPLYFLQPNLYFLSKPLIRSPSIYLRNLSYTHVPPSLLLLCYQNGDKFWNLPLHYLYTRAEYDNTKCWTRALCL